MFYGVYYYVPCSSAANVQIVGFYDDLDIAKKVLNNVLPNYKKNYHNSVRGSNGLIGWINQYEMNQLVPNPSQLSCSQPHTSVNLFDS